MDLDKKVDMIVDLQYGSTGKGLIAGYLATKNEYDTVINANMPNAGHTFIDNKSNKMVHKVLPNGIVSPKLENVMIGPGSVFDVDRLSKEVAIAKKFGYMKSARIYIHPNAVPLRDEYVAAEKAYSRIGSTRQGSAAAMVAKIERDTFDSVILADSQDMIDRIHKIPGCTMATHEDWMGLLTMADKVLAEGAQGFSLSLNGRFYPYCTSRDTGPARFLSDMGIPHYMLKKVIGTARTYPIRVAGESGGYYDDQAEISWGDIKVKEARTTVTNKVRRVFTFSHKQMKEAIWYMGPDEIFLNFCNYSPCADELVNIVADFEYLIRYTGWGPTVNDVEEREDW